MYEEIGGDELSSLNELMGIASEQLGKVASTPPPLTPSSQASSAAAVVPGSFYATKPATVVGSSSSGTGTVYTGAATPEGAVKKAAAAVYRAERTKKAAPKKSEPFLKSFLEVETPSEFRLGRSLQENLSTAVKEVDNLHKVRRGSEAATVYESLRPRPLEGVLSPEAKSQFMAIALMGAVKVATVAVANWARERKVPYELIS